MTKNILTSPFTKIALLGLIALGISLCISGCNDFMTKDISIGGGAKSGDDDEEPVDAPPDKDRDGLSDEIETTNKMKTASGDSDLDGYGDGLEFVGSGGEPLDASIGLEPFDRVKLLSADEETSDPDDKDGDGLGDDFESKHGLFTTSADSDADGYSDSLELIAKSNPFEASSRPSRSSTPKQGETDDTQTFTDADGDGLADRIEALNRTSTTESDTDSDGFSDGIEYVMGSDATNARSIPDFTVPQKPASSSSEETTTGTEDAS